MSEEEYFPIIDENGNVVAKATRRQCHNGSRLLHPVVHLHIFNEKGELYLQKRSHTKDIQPGKWDTAVGGHVDYGESIEQALLREASEELGFTDFHPTPLFQYIFDSDREREMVNAYITTTTRATFTYDPIEIDDARFWNPQEIAEAMGKNVLTPNFEQEYKKMLQALEARRDL